MYQKLPKAVEELVKGFFCDDEFSCQLPGKNTFISIQRIVHMPKRVNSKNYFQK